MIAHVALIGAKRPLRGRGMSRRFWFCAGVTLLSAIVSAGFSVAGLLTEGADRYAQYAASRSVALLIAALVVVALRARAATLVLAGCMTLVQFFDGWIGVLAHDPGKTFGPFALAALNAAAAVLYLRGERRRR
jgi:hypothetical protein